MADPGGNHSQSIVDAKNEPLKAFIIYGSTRGTTATVGEAIAEGMKGAGVSATAMHLDLYKMMPNRLQSVDILGIGSPVYFLREARYVAEFIAGLPPLESKKVFLYCTCGMNRIGETLKRLHELLSERGAVVVGVEQFSSAMSYLPYRRRKLGNLEHLPDEAVLTSARSFGERMAQAPGLAPIDVPPVALVTRLKSRLLTSRTFRRSLFPGIEINRETCTGYGSCISRCPFQGLDRKDGESIPFVTDACIQCLQCVDFCPRAAIKVDTPLKEWLSAFSYRLGLH